MNLMFFNASGNEFHCFQYIGKECHFLRNDFLYVVENIFIKWKRDFTLDTTLPLRKETIRCSILISLHKKGRNHLSSSLRLQRCKTFKHCAQRGKKFSIFSYVKFSHHSLRRRKAWKTNWLRCRSHESPRRQSCSGRREFFEQFVNVHHEVDPRWRNLKSRYFDYSNLS